MEDSDRIRRWVGNRGLSDHCSIFLQVEKDDNKPAGPFKFNTVWMEDEEFIKLVKAKETYLATKSRVSNVSVCKEFKTSEKSITGMGKREVLIFRRKISGSERNDILDV